MYVCVGCGRIMEGILLCRGDECPSLTTRSVDKKARQQHIARSEREEIRETVVGFCPLAGASPHENHSGRPRLLLLPPLPVLLLTPGYVRSGPARPRPALARIAGISRQRAGTLPPSLWATLLYIPRYAS
jgi:hypothetical protein